MSLLNYSRYPCVHCQGNAFRAEFEDMGGELGRVKFLRCLNCNVAYADYTPEQKALLAKWEAEAEHDRDPDGLMCEGAQAQVKRIRRISEDILRNRAVKVCHLGIRKGMGDTDSIPELPPEEKVLRLQVAGNYQDMREAMKGVSE